jgi:hypothetical protein
LVERREGQSGAPAPSPPPVLWASGVITLAGFGRRPCDSGAVTDGLEIGGVFAGQRTAKTAMAAPTPRMRKPVRLFGLCFLSLLFVSPRQFRQATARARARPDARLPLLLSGGDDGAGPAPVWRRAARFQAATWFQWPTSLGAVVWRAGRLSALAAGEAQRTRWPTAHDRRPDTTDCLILVV